MKNKVTLLFFIISLKIFAQLPCSTATVLTNITNYCSNNAQYTNVPVLTGTTSIASCWTAGTTQDVWFSFTATQTDVLISVTGNDGSGSGTMNNPCIALYTGPCAATLSEIGCSNGTSSSTQLYKGGLSPGVTYLIRVSTTPGNKGTFKLCVNNYTPTLNPGADCSGAVYLCNKNPISVAGLSGGGMNNEEPEFTTCFQGTPETNSCWYTFTCQTSGTLTFDLIPSNITNDIDFIFYKLNTTNVCGTRTAIRCNCSSCVNSNGPTNGYTGLNTTSTDTSVTGGCNPPQNSYCKQANLVAGVSYAILINNFSAASGFTINWGGSSTFLGPTPKIVANDTTICAGQTVTFDGSTSTNCNTLTWNFVSGGNPTSAAGAGPTTVTYNTPGSYVAILDGVSTGGCETVTSKHVIVSASPTVTIAPPSTLTCTSPSLQLSATATPLPVTYTWTGPGITAGVNTTTATVNAPGIYTVMVTNATGCPASATVAVTQKGTPTATATESDVLCNGGSTGSASVTASSGTAPYTYSWSPSGGTGVTASNLLAGTYTVTVTDNVGCTTKATTTVNQPVLLTSTTSITDVLCNGGSTGSITVTVSGGTTPYTYSWSPSGGTGTIASNLAIGTYTVNIKDHAGCINTATATVNQPTLLTAMAAETDVLCNGDNTGSATVTAIGGTSPYTYSWLPSGGTAAVAPGLAAGTYTVNVKDHVGCTTTANTTVNQPSALTVTTNKIDVFCGSNTGTATVTANGGSPPYTYVWTGTTQNTQTVSLAPGNYTVTVTDANSCTGTSTLTILNVSSSVLSVDNPTICIGSPATITVSGGTSYTWTPATGLSATSGNSVTATNLSSTTVYTITANSAGSCSATTTATVTVNTLPNLSINSPTICVSQQTATLTVNGADTYTWNPTTGLSSSIGSGINAIPPSTQNYTVTGTDANGCVNTVTTTVTVNSLPTITVNSASICLGQQTATLTAGGASTYSWTPLTNLTPSTGSIVTAKPPSTQNYTVTGIDLNGCVNTATTSVTIYALPNVTSTTVSVCQGFPGTLTAGGASTYTWNTGTMGSSLTDMPSITSNYTVSGTNANSCTNTAVGTITVIPALTITVNNGSICVGQQTTTLIAGGAVNYVWNPTTGLIPATGSVVAANPTVTTIYTVTGSIGTCTATTTLTVTVNPLPVPTATANTPCQGQQALNIGAMPNNMQNYSWTGPNSFTATGQNQSINSTNVVLADAGTYTLVVIDANSCKNSTTIQVKINPKPTITATGATVCVGQTINLNSNGAGSGTYYWNGPTTYSSFSSNSQDTSIVNAATFMSGLYSVIGTDANGCQNAAFAQVIVNSPPLISVNSATICQGQQTATLTASGAGAAGIYSWNPSAELGSNGNESIVTGTPSSTQVYTVTGTDAHTCTSSATATITVDSIPLVTVNADSICLGQQTATLSASGGANTYAWFPPIGLAIANGSSVTATPSATQGYTVTATFANGCVSKASTQVVVYPIPIPDFDYAHQPINILDPRVYFVNQSVGSIALYNWNFGDIYGNKDSSSSVKNPLYTYANIGIYDVTLSVVSTQGCSASVVKPVVINPDYTLYVPNAFTPNSDGKNEVFKAEGEGITNFKMYVFDRWGLLLFYSDDINTGWDGHYQGKGTNILQQDVYVWKIEAYDFNNIPKNLHGTVTLLR